MNLIPLITAFSQSIGMILSKTVTFLVAMVTNFFSGFYILAYLSMMFNMNLLIYY